MKTLKPIQEKRVYEEIIYKRMRSFFDDFLFSYIEEVIKSKRFENALSLREYLLRGIITYEKGIFKGYKRFPSHIAKEIEDMGGIWSKTEGGYKINPQLIPADILQAVAEINIENGEKLKKIYYYLDDIEDTKDYVFENLSFELEAKKIVSDLDRQFKTSMKPTNALVANLTDFQKLEISKNYTKNLEFYIQKWSKEEIVKLREDIEPLTMQGYRAESLKNIILKHKKVTSRKAKFLARNETGLLIAEYQKNRFKQAGINQYRWITKIDGRERPWHKKLNGKIFSWDNPPIIDERTGQRGNPKETYNCRCNAAPVVNWTRLNNDKTDANGCLHGDDGKFKSKTAQKSVVNLSKEEYNHVVHELNNNLTKKEFKRGRTIRYIGNYGYDVIINDFNDYKIAAKWSIEDADN